MGAAAIAPAIGLGGSLLGGMFGGKQSGAQKDALRAQSNLMNTQSGALRQGVDVANALQPTAQNLLSQSSSTYQPAIDYWSRILSGDAGAMTSALAPETQQISNQYGAASRAADTSLARGGYRSSTLANLPFQQAQTVGNLFSTLRPQAAQQLSGIGGQLGGLGAGLSSSVLGGLLGAGGGAGATGSSLLNNANVQAGNAFNTGGAFGSGLYNIIKAIPGLSGGSAGGSGGGGLGK